MNILTYPPKAGEKTPEWKRSVLFTDDANIFIPFSYTGRSDGEVLLRAGFDGAEFITNEGNHYISLSWAEKEYPDASDLYELIKARVKENLPSIPA
jgi:hypothetical protein